ncbi:sugar kinase [Holotrichia oblita]|uniref:Sugar kinase n=1 Tax=Holotrichia oblita TaxID=644536 RepID=A0ACB9TXF2_HOLOL|nr:sugar kinase [Holotrichia oblita]
MPRLIGAIDIGTSSTRFILFQAETSVVVAVHQIELKKTFPQEGWVEQDPVEILNAVNESINKAIEKFQNHNGDITDILAVGVTNQRESTIVWDKNMGQPLYNSIVWLDMRTTSTVERLLDTVPNKTRNKNYLKPLCGLPLSPYFSGVKLKWLYDNDAKIKKAMDSGSCLFGTVDTWIIWNLTGGVNGGIHITDVSNASRTMLMNIENLNWDPVLLKFFNIPHTILPTIKSSSEVYGVFSNGPLKGVRLSGCVGDQQSALIGQQCLSPGQAKATYGTGCFLLYNTGTVKVDSTHGLLTTVAYQLGSRAPPVYALEGSVAIAGAAFSWLRDNLNILPSYSETQHVAEQADLLQEGNVYFVPAFSGLYAPYWQQDARGVICGITEHTQSSHIVRAALDAVCFQVRDVVEAMNKDYGSVLSSLQVDGGMTANPFLMQLQADLTGIKIIKPDMSESTALGAAMVAGAAVGEWNIYNRRNTSVHTWSPVFTENERDIRYKKWKEAIERSLGWGN